MQVGKLKQAEQDFKKALSVVEMQGIWPNVQVHRADAVPTPNGAMEGGRITDPEAVAEALRGLLNRMHVSTRDAVMGISTQSVLTRTLDIPRVPDNEVRTILVGELAHYQILRENSETFDYIRMEPPHGGHEREREAGALLALRREEGLEIEGAGRHAREIDRTVGEFAPILWEEGLAQPVLLALQRKKHQGMAGAEAALAEVERRGARARIVALIVLRLAAQLSDRAAGVLSKLGFELWPPPNGAIL